MKRNSTLFCLLFFIAASLFTTPAKAQVNVNDSLALVDLYNSTDGPHWNNKWTLEKPVSTWYGVTLTDRRVTGLRLDGNGLSVSGSVPASIGNLIRLSSLYLIGNQLSGTIPSTIGNLVNLTYLYLYNNQLSGTIPAEIGNLVNLNQLNLSSNQLSGSIPSSIGNLVKLQYLYLNHNQLSDAIPAEIGNCTNLEWLYLDYNQLSGAIPSSIGNLVNLRYLYLNHNQLSGAIPASFLRFKPQYLDLSYNQLSQDRNIQFFTETNDYTRGHIEHNHFTFDGLEFIAKYYLRSHYAQQANIPIRQNGNVLSVYAGGTLSNNSYRWHQVGTEGSTVVKGDSTFTPSQSGKYYVTVSNKIAVQLKLCSDTIDFTLSPLKQSSNTLISKGAQAEMIIQHMLVYPNPARDIVHVQVKGTAMIAIADANSKVMLSKSINNSDAINVSALAPGTYYLQNKATGEVQKIVVVH